MAQLTATPSVNLRQESGGPLRFRLGYNSW
jgi:hypothetical protein